MPQDQWQDTLADAAETDEKNSPWEIDVYGVIAHDAPECLRSGGAPSDDRLKAAAYQSDQRTASEHIRKFSTRELRATLKVTWWAKTTLFAGRQTMRRR